MDLTGFEPYTSPINPNIFPHLTALLLGMGLFFTTWFFIYVVSRPKNSKGRSLLKEIMLAFCSSLFLGCGFIFLLLSAGIYI